MKKILSVFIIVAVMTGIACIGTSAADAPVVFSLLTDGPAEGADEFTVDVVASLPEGREVAQFGLEISIPAELTFENCEQVISFGSFETSENYIIDPYVILWVSGTSSLPEGDTVIATLTFSFYRDVTRDVTYDIGINLDPENLPASVAGDEYDADDVVLTGASVIVKGEPVETTTEPESSTEETTREPIYRPVYTGDGTDDVIACPDDYDDYYDSVVETDAASRTDEAPVDSDEAPVDSDDAPADSNKPADTAATNQQRPQGGNSATTGDAAFVVVAVMVATLGTAIVVKKVCVK